MRDARRTLHAIRRICSYSVVHEDTCFIHNERMYNQRGSKLSLITPSPCSGIFFYGYFCSMLLRITM
ncbi:unnamed protein product [Dicrocoelium dendriticum]|nr:unnamed protein product [Dicrocoelium dendriticum]